MSMKAKAIIAAMFTVTVITPLPLQRMFGARIRRKAVPYVTTEIAGEMELFPAHSRPSANHKPGVVFLMGSTKGHSTA